MLSRAKPNGFATILRVSRNVPTSVAERTGARPFPFKSASSYVLAVVLVVGATFVTVHVPILKEMRSLWLHLLAVTLVSWYAGAGPGMLAVVTSAASFAYYVAPPEGFAMRDPHDLVRVGMFVVVAGVISFFRRSKTAAERSAEAIGRRLAEVLDATGTGVWEMNLRTGALVRSTRLEDIYGRRGASFPDTYVAFMGLVHPDDRPLVHNSISAAMEEGGEYQISHRIVRPDGEIRTVETRGRVMPDASGKPERVVGVTSDATRATTHAEASEVMHPATGA